jgi:hypothetical protein
MTYTQKHFEQCLFNPLILDRMVSAYPVLYEIVPKELDSEPALDGLLRYVILVYDPKSPLVVNERDLNYRKGTAAELAQIKLLDEIATEALYNCAYPGLLDLTCKYLVRFAKSKEWAAICAYEYKFWEAIRLIMQPIAADKSDREQLDAANKKDVLSASIDEGLTKLDQYYKAFFGGDDELEKKAKKRLTPELMARKEA